MLHREQKNRVVDSLRVYLPSSLIGRSVIAGHNCEFFKPEFSDYAQASSV